MKLTPVRQARCTTLVWLAVAAGLAACSATGVEQPHGAVPPPTQTIVAPGLGGSVDRYVRAAADLGFSGVLLITSGDDILVNGGYGFADRARGTRFNPATPIGLASVSKVFTAAAVLRLHESGALDVNDPVAAHLSGWPTDKSGITIHHLLTHTSGLPVDVARDEESFGRETLLERAFAVQWTGKPGTRWVYSNLGYSLLAAVVEEASGQPFEVFVRRQLLEPAGMLETSFTTSDDRRSSVFCGYRAFQSACIVPGSTFHGGRLSWSLMGGAGMISTALDLHRWDRALAAGHVLADSTQRMALTGYAAISSGVEMGYGWFIRETAGDRRAYHTGGDGVAGISYERFLDRDMTVVQFSNNSNGGVYRHVVVDVGAILAGGSPRAIPVAAAAVPPERLRDYCGRYVTADGERLEIVLRNGQLHLPLDRTPGRVISMASGQPHAASAAQRDTAVALTRRVLTEIGAGELSTVLKLLPTGADVAEERWFWSTWWPTMVADHGALLRVDYLGSASSATATELRLLVHFERGSQYIRASARADGSWSFAPSYQAPLPPGSFHFIPLGTDSFRTHTFATDHSADLTFDVIDGRVTGLRIAGGEEALVARREAGCESLLIEGNWTGGSAHRRVPPPDAARAPALPRVPAFPLTFDGAPHSSASRRTTGTGTPVRYSRPWKRQWAEVAG